MRRSVNDVKLRMVKHQAAVAAASRPNTRPTSMVLKDEVVDSGETPLLVIE
jgi:hypothetical protein